MGTGFHLEVTETEMNIKVSFEGTVTSKFTETLNIPLGQHSRTIAVDKSIVTFQF